MDFLDTSGREREKVWLDCTSNDAVTMGIRDFDDHWRQYVAEFLER